MAFEFRPYQTKAHDLVLEKWRDMQKLLLVMATGTGKTLVFSKIIESLLMRDAAGKIRPLILAHRDELIRQAQDKLRVSTGIEAAIEKAGETALGSYYPVTIGSVQTLMREKRLQQFSPDHYSHIIVDEAHHALAESYKKIFAYFCDAKVLGVTATPDRGDKKNLGQFFDDLAFEYGMREAIKDGYLCTITAETVPININLKDVKCVAGDFKASDLGSAIEPYLEQVAGQMKKLAFGRKILVFLPLVRTSKMFEQILTAHGFRPCHIDGKSEDRREILHMYNQNRYDVICNAMLLTEGYDQPDIDCIVDLSPTRSRSLYAQKVGRGTRPAPDKVDLLILDFLWNTDRHDLCQPAHLIAESEEVAEKMIENAKAGGRMGLEEMESKAHGEINAEREDTLARYLDANSRRKGKTVDPMAFGILIGSEDITDYDPTFKWEKDKISDKQAAVLANNGFDPTSMTKGYASKILDGIFKRRENDLASPKQVMLLTRFGHRNFSELTFKEASAKIDRIAKNGWSADFRKEKK